jgi:hypothetical protein
MAVKSFITLVPRLNLIKLFTVVIYGSSYYARLFITGRPFQPSLMFLSKARILPYNGAFEGASLTRVGSNLSHKP